MRLWAQRCLLSSLCIWHFPHKTFLANTDIPSAQLWGSPDPFKCQVLWSHLFNKWNIEQRQQLDEIWMRTLHWKDIAGKLIKLFWFIVYGPLKLLHLVKSMHKELTTMKCVFQGYVLKSYFAVVHHWRWHQSLQVENCAEHRGNIFFKSLTSYPSKGHTPTP